MQRSAFFFAEGCGRRPCSTRSESAWSGVTSRESGAVAGWTRRIEPATPAGEITSPRQEVSEPIGLGRSVHRERSRWTESSRDAIPALCRRPLTRETSTGRCTKVIVGHPQPGTRPKRRAGGRSRKVLGPSGSTRRKPRALGSCRKSRARRVRGANPELDNREDSCTSGRPQVRCCGVRSPWSCSRIATVAEVDRRREATLAHARRARGQRGTV